MSIRDVVRNWILEYAYAKKMPKAVKALQPNDGLPSIPGACLVPRMLACTLTLIIQHKEYAAFGTAVQLANALYDNSGDIIPFKAFAKILTGIKILHLFSMLRNGERHVLPTLNKYFPRTGFMHAKADEKLLKRLGSAQMKFRKFLLSLLANDNQRKVYLKREFYEEYGDDFVQKLQQLTRDFAAQVEDVLPSTMIDKLLKQGPNSDFALELAAAGGLSVEILLDALHGKKRLSEEDVLDIVEIFSQKARAKKPQRHTPIDLDQLGVDNSSGSMRNGTTVQRASLPGSHTKPGTSPRGVQAKQGMSPRTTKTPTRPSRMKVKLPFGSSSPENDTEENKENGDRILEPSHKKQPARQNQGNMDGKGQQQQPKGGASSDSDDAILISSQDDSLSNEHTKDSPTKQLIVGPTGSSPTGDRRAQTSRTATIEDSPVPQSPGDPEGGSQSMGVEPQTIVFKDNSVPQSPASRKRGNKNSENEPRSKRTRVDELMLLELSDCMSSPGMTSSDWTTEGGDDSDYVPEIKINTPVSCRPSTRRRTTAFNIESSKSSVSPRRGRPLAESPGRQAPSITKSPVSARRGRILDTSPRRMTAPVTKSSPSPRRGKTMDESPERPAAPIPRSSPRRGGALDTSPTRQTAHVPIFFYKSSARPLRGPGLDRSPGRQAVHVQSPTRSPAKKEVHSDRSFSSVKSNRKQKQPMLDNNSPSVGTQILSTTTKQAARAGPSLIKSDTEQGSSSDENSDLDQSDEVLNMEVESASPVKTPANLSQKAKITRRTGTLNSARKGTASRNDQNNENSDTGEDSTADFTPASLRRTYTRQSQKTKTPADCRSQSQVMKEAVQNDWTPSMRTRKVESDKGNDTDKESDKDENTAISASQVETQANQSEESKVVAGSGVERPGRPSRSPVQSPNRSRSPPSSAQSMAHTSKSLEEGAWDCLVCTFRNFQEAFKCEMCDVCKGTSTRYYMNDMSIMDREAKDAPLPYATQKTSTLVSRSKSSLGSPLSPRVTRRQGSPARAQTLPRSQSSPEKQLNPSSKTGQLDKPLDESSDTGEDSITDVTPASQMKTRTSQSPKVKTPDSSARSQAMKQAARKGTALSARTHIVEYHENSEVEDEPDTSMSAPQVKTRASQSEEITLVASSGEENQARSSHSPAQSPIRSQARSSHSPAQSPIRSRSPQSAHSVIMPMIDLESTDSPHGNVEQRTCTQVSDSRSSPRSSRSTPRSPLSSRLTRSQGSSPARSQTPPCAQSSPNAKSKMASSPFHPQISAHTIMANDASPSWVQSSPHPTQSSSDGSQQSSPTWAELPLWRVAQRLGIHKLTPVKSAARSSDSPRVITLAVDEEVVLNISADSNEVSLFDEDGSTQNRKELHGTLESISSEEEWASCNEETPSAGTRNRSFHSSGSPVNYPGASPVNKSPAGLAEPKPAMAGSDESAGISSPDNPSSGSSLPSGFFYGKGKRSPKPHHAPDSKAGAWRVELDKNQELSAVHGKEVSDPQAHIYT